MFPSKRTATTSHAIPPRRNVTAVNRIAQRLLAPAMQPRVANDHGRLTFLPRSCEMDIRFRLGASNRHPAPPSRRGRRSGSRLGPRACALAELDGVADPAEQRAEGTDDEQG